MIERLKAALARRPLVSFFALGGTAWALFVVATYVLPHVWIRDPFWIEYVSLLTYVALALLGLTCCWAVSGPADERPRRLTQVCVAVAVALLFVGVGVVRIWIMWQWMRTTVEAESAKVAGTHFFDAMPSLGRYVHDYLRQTSVWLQALTAGLVLAAVASPFPFVRRTARSLVAWRGARVWRLVALAVLVVAGCVVATRVAAQFVGAGGASLHAPVAYLPVDFVVSLFLPLTAVFAWYGFAAGRLNDRLSPLGTGLVIGLGIALPEPLALWLASGGASPWNRWNALGMAGTVAIALVGVWLARSARGSLLPTVVWVAGMSTGVSIAMWTTTGSRADWVEQYHPVTAMAAAALFVVAGRMWRRPEAVTSPPAPDPPAPPPGSYEVIVRDVSMPL